MPLSHALAPPPPTAPQVLLVLVCLKSCAAGDCWRLGTSSEPEVKTVCVCWTKKRRLGVLVSNRGNSVRNLTWDRYREVSVKPVAPITSCSRRSGSSGGGALEFPVLGALLQGTVLAEAELDEIWSTTQGALCGVIKFWFGAHVFVASTVHSQQVTFISGGVSGSLGKVALYSPPPFSHLKCRCMDSHCEIKQPVPIELGKLTVWKMFRFHPLTNSDIFN